jgi:hypothetical protein
MFSRIITVSVVAASCVFTAPSVAAEPAPSSPTVDDPMAVAVPPPPDGAVPSEPPGVLVTPEGWTLTVAGEDERQVAVNPLTTARSSREYLVAGTFTGSVTGTGTTTLSGGSLEVGYQIGCGIALDKVKMSGSIGFGPTGSIMGVPTGVSFPMSGTIEVTLKPGEVINAQVMKKEFKGQQPRVTVHDSHIKIDGCVGQSFLRSYAVLTSKSDVVDDIIAYYGVTKVV